MRYNEFSNIMNGITENITSGTYTTSAMLPLFSANGTYAALLVASDNTFTPTGATNAFVNNAITISSPLTNTVNWTTAPDYNISPSIVGYNIERNQINNVYRGIYLNGCGVGFPSLIEDNVVTLTDDNVFYAPQHGIHVNGTFGKNVVRDNLASSSNTINSLQSLYYFSTNLGVTSPSVSCNTATNCSKGFEFNSVNGTTLSPMCTYWRGNDMENLQMGMVLSGTTGIIGPQGSNTGAGANPSDNRWLGTWTGNNGVYADNSNALLSPIVTKTGSTYSITGASGNGPFLSQYYGALGTIFNYNFGSYSCGDFSSNRTMTMSPSFSDTKDRYIANTAMYRFLRFNDSIRAVHAPLNSFYTGKADSSYSKFMDVEDSLYSGKFSNAASLNSGITVVNSVESNYKLYYSLYAAAAADAFAAMSSEDSTELKDLAELCPSADGAVVYQARALFNTVYNSSYVFPESCSGSSSKSYYSADQKFTYEKDVFDISIYPNPANNQITLSSGNEKEFLEIVIYDISNRIVLKMDLKINSFLANLGFDLVNGSYHMTITNQKGESVSKKLIVAK